MIASWFLDRSAAREELKHQHYERDHQQNMHETAKDVPAHEAEQPQNEKNNEDRPKHCRTSLTLELFRGALSEAEPLLYPPMEPDTRGRPILHHTRQPSPSL